MNRKLDAFLAALEITAKMNIKFAEKGSPATSMAEDSTIAEVGKEQLRICKAIRALFEDKSRRTS